VLFTGGPGAVATGAEQSLEVVIAEPYIELRSGPGKGFPIFYVAERGERVAILKRRTEWYKIELGRGADGWVHERQLVTTLGLDGTPFDVPELAFDDYAERRWEAGVLYGDFGGANAISAYGAVSLTPNLSAELSIEQVLGRFADSTLATLSVVHLFYPDRRASPYFTLGTGSIHTEPKATLVATVDRTDSLALVGAGARVYLARRFVFRAEYKSYVVFTSRDDNEEIREWKAGLSFFF
jgi:hypothetical protein